MRNTYVYRLLNHLVTQANDEDGTTNQMDNYDLLFLWPEEDQFEFGNISIE